MRRRPFHLPPGRRNLGPACALAGEGLSPRGLGPALRLWIDPARTDLMRIVDSAEFVRSQARRLSTPHHADFNFAQRFTLEFWKSNRSRGTDRTFVCKYNYGVGGGRAGGWSVNTGGSVGQEDALRILVALADNDADIVAADTAAPHAEWSHCAIVYNGSLGADAQRLVVYLDGQPKTLSFLYIGAATQLPASLATNTAPVTLGTHGGTLAASRHVDACLSRVRLWNQALSAGAVDELYNAGAGLVHAQLSAGQKTGLVASRDLDEAPGQRDDRSGAAHHLTETGGAIGQGRVVVELRERGAERLVFRAPYRGGPLWRAAALGGRPALEMFFQQWMTATVANWPGGAAGDLLQVMRFRALKANDNALFGSSDTGEPANSKYMFHQVYDAGGGNVYSSLRIRDDANPNGAANSSLASLAIETNYLFNWRGLGAGGDASYQCRVNGADTSVTLGHAPPGNDVRNRWWASVTARDVVSLGALERQDGVQNRCHALFGEAVAVAPLASATRNRRLERWLARRAGIALA